MKSFLLHKNIPIIKFSLLPDNCFFEGKLPDGDYSLAVCPGKYIVLDVDNKSEDKNGFNNIPDSILEELNRTFNYKTKSGNGRHYWLLYSGNKVLVNTSTKHFLDLRIGEKPGNAGGYVRYHHSVDIRQCECLIKETSSNINAFLDNLFCGINNK